MKFRGENMKILFITNNINQIGGVDRVLNRLSNYFALKFNYDIEILSLFTRESNLFFKYDDTVKITHGDIDINTNKLELIKCIRKLLLKDDSDIIITFHGFISNIILLNKDILKNKKIIVTEHGDYFDSSKKRRIIRSILYRKADKVIVLTNKSKELYNRYLNNVQVIPNPISFNTDKIGNMNNKKIIAVGRLEEVKRFNLLIDIFKKVSDIHNEWSLDIIGDGSQRNNLQSIINKYKLNDKVKLKHFTKDILNEYLEASIYALTSQYEGFGLVLTEAKECGLPCISFDIDAAKEIIVDNEDGILINDNNIDYFVDKLSLLINDIDLRTELSRNAKYNAKKYSIENIGYQWNELFSSLLKN